MKYNPDDFNSLAAMFHHVADRHPTELVCQYPELDEDDKLSGPRKWVKVSYSETQERINKVAAYLLELGVKTGEKVAILSSSRKEWAEADLSILSCGATTVSIYQSLPAPDAAYIIFDSEAEIIFAENREQAEKLLHINSSLSSIPATEERKELTVEVRLKKIIIFESVDLPDDSLIVSWDSIVSGEKRGVPDSVAQVKRDDIASLVYTSGTTGPPKGVIQSHHNHLSNVRQAATAGVFHEKGKIMIFLPLAHSFARLVYYIGYLMMPGVVYAGVFDRRTSRLNAQSMTRDIAEGGAGIIPVVPRILEKMRNGIVAKSSKGGLAGYILRITLWAARERYAALSAGKQPRTLVQMVFEGTAGIRSKIKKALFGEDFMFCVSGGAKLPVEVCEFFDSLGMDIIEGYGLTETCVATNLNRVQTKKIGTVGPVLADDVELRIAEDGEILYRGPNIALGYYNRPSATKKSWDEEGWFHTGDLGTVDEDGFLKIIGRKKEIIVTAGGKNIAPLEIEDKIKESKYVSQAVMLGDGMPYCVALLTLDDEQAQNWASRQGVPPTELHENEKLKNLIWSDVETVNRGQASFETVKKIAILPEDFSVENGMLTPTFKVKRNVVAEHYKDLIDALYS